MKKNHVLILYSLIIILFIILCKNVFADVSPSDLTDFTSNLSQIVSFFGGVLAIMAFIMGTHGGGGVS
jgi:hypothetical protein